MVYEVTALVTFTVDVSSEKTARRLVDDLEGCAALPNGVDILAVEIHRVDKPERKRGTSE